DHGSAQRTGLAWEHVASGLSPEAGRRWGAVEFDPSSYTAWQEGARFTPWWARLRRNVVVFDTPYVDLRRARTTRGIVGWGAHDPGIPASAAPADLRVEFEQRFGAYPATPWLYGTPWASPARTQAMGTALARALDVRTVAARWLACERLRDWELFMAVAGEAHSAGEGLWHGVGPGHPPHTPPPGPAAAPAEPRAHPGLARVGSGGGSSDARRASSTRSHGCRAGGGGTGRDDRGLCRGRNGSEPLRHPIHGALARASPPPRLRRLPAAPTRCLDVGAERRADARRGGGLESGERRLAALAVAWPAGRGVRRVPLLRAGLAPSGAGAAQGGPRRGLRLAVAGGAAGALECSVAARDVLSAALAKHARFRTAFLL